MDSRFRRHLKALFTASPHGLLLGLLLGLGVILRVREYLVNRSLWLDEALLALNVLGKSAADLVLRPLDFNQGAPPGFLLLVKLAVYAFGTSEYALRLVPFLFSIASLPLLAWVAVRVLAPEAALVAVALFAVLQPLIRYAGEFKQYTVDVAVGLGILTIALPFLDGPTTARRGAALALAGAFALWLSHPAPFILAAVGVALLLQWWRKGQVALRTLIAIGAAWLASFIAVYLVSLRHLTAHEVLHRMWVEAFAPSVFSPSILRWLVNQTVDLFAYAFGAHSESVGALAVLAGCISLLTSQSAHLVLFIAPVLFALAAAVMGKYPFQGRLLLFALPLLVLLAAAGAERIRRSLHGFGAAAVLLIALLLFNPAYASLSRLIRPDTRSEVRPVLAHMQRQFRPEDVLYVSFLAHHAFEYYAGRLDFRPQRLVIGEFARREFEKFAADLDRLRGRGRVWVLLSHLDPEDERFIQYYLDTLGTRLDTFRAPGATAFLYDLR